MVPPPDVTPAPAFCKAPSGGAPHHQMSLPCATIHAPCSVARTRSPLAARCSFDGHHHHHHHHHCLHLHAATLRPPPCDHLHAHVHAATTTTTATACPQCNVAQGGQAHRGAVRGAADGVPVCGRGQRGGRQAGGWATGRTHGLRLCCAPPQHAAGCACAPSPRAPRPARQRLPPPSPTCPPRQPTPPRMQAPRLSLASR